MRKKKFKHKKICLQLIFGRFFVETIGNFRFGNNMSVAFKTPQETLEECKILSLAVDAHKDDGKDGKISASTTALVASISSTPLNDWKVKWSRATATERMPVIQALSEMTNTRRKRLKLSAKRHRDTWEAYHHWILERSIRYQNVPNGRGKAFDRPRHGVPQTKENATSTIDWEAAVEAKLLFAMMPNLSPKQPVPGARHSMQ
jgi:hypothetical protein